jgi:hypothetical protein
MTVVHAPFQLGKLNVQADFVLPRYATDLSLILISCYTSVVLFATTIVGTRNRHYLTAARDAHQDSLPGMIPPRERQGC